MDIKLALYLLFAACVIGEQVGVYEYGRHAEKVVQEAERTKAIAAQQQLNYAALMAYAERVSKGEKQHDQDQDTINRLAAERNRLRVHVPTCPVPTTAATGTSQDGSAGVLSNRVDEYFAAFQASTGQLIQRCDQLNIDAIRLNSVHYSD